MGTLLPSVMSSGVRGARSPGHGTKDLGGTQRCVSAEAELCMLILSCYLSKRKLQLTIAVILEPGTCNGWGGGGVTSSPSEWVG